MATLLQSPGPATTGPPRGSASPAPGPAPNRGGWVAFVGSVLCALGGAVVLGAWFLDELWVIRSSPSATPIFFNTGVCFLLSGTALALQARAMASRLVLAAAAAVGLVAAVSFAEQVLDRGLGVDQLLFRTDVAGPGGAPGRMAANTAVGFLLVVAALVARTSRPGRRGTAVTAVAGGVVLALGSSALGGYAFGQEKGYRWGSFTPMAPQTAVLFVLLAAVLLVLAWTDAPEVTDASVSAPTHRGLSDWSVRRVVALVAVLAYLPLVAMALIGMTVATRAITAEAKGKVESAAVLEARALGAQLEGLRVLTRALAGRTALAQALTTPRPDPRVLQAELEQGLHSEPGVASMGITDVHGIMLAVAPPTPGAVGRDFSFRDWYRGVSAQGDAYVSEAIQSVVRGNPYVVVVATPVRAQASGPVVGYLTLGYELTALQAFVARFDAALRTALVVTDQRGVVVAAATPPTGLTPRRNDGAVRAALAGRTGVVSQPGPHGTQLVGFAPVADLGWTVSARVDRSVALARVGTLRATAVAVALVIAAALVAVLVLVARVWRRRAESERALAVAVRELGRSNEELEQFAYVASHDLSEPLRAIAGPISLVAQRYKGQLDPESDQFIDFAVDGCSRMQQLIDGLLAFSRVGRLENPTGPVDCALVMSGVLDSLGPALAESGAQIEVGPLPTVEGEAHQLGQVFSNLVGNALKFHRPDVAPVVSVAAARQGAQWRFTVTDNGIGIAPEHRERVFGMFKRLHGRDAYPGTGIGLALVRKIVERHGGQVGVEDAPSGQGCAVWFTIPADKE